ncbi:LPXTG cell wall anchor domain-containing protein [Listeria seeligeri]|uniref:LPXTG cell wall anchor domain-containing protein n=1 Tax=Listeria seeligeri TaxID=1640 RepID=A0A7X1C6Y6_LISSE|nr:LPXTG cell wall anchor domain-containing protein [Listeria seeligeri]MBC1486619.1 LPXTG cell wall anchor domain-containing protein [Listeria seeligeri]
MKKFRGLVFVALLTCLITPFSLAASAETNENGNNQPNSEEKVTNPTENTVPEVDSKTTEPTKNSTTTETPQTTIDITDSAEVYTYEQNSDIELSDFTATLSDHTGTKLSNYRLAEGDELSTETAGVQELTLLGDTKDGDTMAVKLNYLVKAPASTLTVTNLNFDLETKIFSGKTKPFASVYMSSPEDENFGEGRVEADKDGNFYASWATTPKEITAYAFDDAGNFSEEVTYTVPTKKENEEVTKVPAKVKQIENTKAVKSVTTKASEDPKKTQTTKSELPGTGDQGVEWIFVVAGVIVILIGILLLRKRKK